MRPGVAAGHGLPVVLMRSEGVAEREEGGRGGEKKRLEALADAADGETLESVLRGLSV